MSKHVAVLMGGWSAERQVSLSTGNACASALRSAGYRVTEVDVDRSIAQTLAKLHPDVCFNALHGPFGEDGNIQGLLNIIGIPYTHSGVQASALAMDKPRSKRIFKSAGLRCPDGVVCSRDDTIAGNTYDPPYVLKPINQGSSVGVHIIRAGDNHLPVIGDWPFGEEVLLEPYIPGRELTVGVFDGNAFCVTEITSDHGFYNYEAKYEEGGSVHLLPAPLPSAITEEAQSMAIRAHEVLGCRGVTRCDFRYDDTDDREGEGRLYLLEINTQPGMTATSLVPEQAVFRGIPFPTLLSRMVEDAQCDL
ncbi:MAG: D-alanine--D-alanine ligase [Rhodospirillaceae bacterium]|nr:D-alanine--D-alanine ligase [Rhodospirillaceae bacterium]